MAALCISLGAAASSVTYAAQNGKKLVIDRKELFAKSGPVEPRSLTLPTCGPDTQAAIRQPVSNDAGYGRVRLTFTGDLPADGWSIQTVSGDSGERWMMTAADAVEIAKDRAKSGESTTELVVWSDAIRGGAKSVILTRERADGRCPSVRISGLLIDAVQSSPSSIVKPDDLRSLLSQRSTLLTRKIDPAMVNTWAKSIARLRYVSDDDGVGYFCTGFLVTPRLLLTNEHCLRTPSEARSAEADFDFDSEGERFNTIRVKSLVRASSDLDYALVELNTPATGRTPLTLAVSNYMSKPDMLVVQHPSGKVKHASIVDCLAERNDVAGTSQRATDFTHRCDTEGGSSGAPVYHIASGHVVGLHHFGVVEGDDSSRNQAVKMADVMDDLQTLEVRDDIESKHAHLAAEIQALVAATVARR